MARTKIKINLNEFFFNKKKIITRGTNYEGSLKRIEIKKHEQ